MDLSDNKTKYWRYLSLELLFMDSIESLLVKLSSYRGWAGYINFTVIQTGY